MRQHRSPGGVWLRIALTLTLIAFFAQSFAVQTHVHFSSAAEAAVADNANALQKVSLDGRHRVSAAKPGKTAPPDDSAGCPLCQEYLYAGNYVTPAAISVVPPDMAASPTLVDIRETSPVWVTSHNWQGRAPPLL